MHTSDIFQISIFAIVLAALSLTTGVSDAAGNSSSLDRKTREPAQKAGSGVAGFTLKAPPSHSDYVEGSGGGPIGGDSGKLSTGKGSDPDVEDDGDVTDDGVFEGSGATPGVKDTPAKLTPVRFQIPGNDLVPEGSGAGPTARDSWEVDNTHAPGQVTTSSTALPPALTEPPNNDLTFSTPDSMSEQDKEFLGVNQPEIVEKQPNQHTSLLAQPAMLAAVIGGAVVGLLCAILLVMYLIYRMRKKDEGSYALDEPNKRSGGYMRAPTKADHNKEYYA